MRKAINAALGGDLIRGSRRACRMRLGSRSRAARAVLPMCFQSRNARKQKLRKSLIYWSEREDLNLRPLVSQTALNRSHLTRRIPVVPSRVASGSGARLAQCMVIWPSSPTLWLSSLSGTNPGGYVGFIGRRASKSGGGPSRVICQNSNAKNGTEKCPEDAHQPRPISS